MLANHAARVLAVRPRLGAKARRVRRQAHRQLRSFDDGVAHEIRQRDLGRRNEAELVLAFEREQVRGELWQLAGTEQRRIVDEVGNVSFGVAMLARVQIQHQLRDCAMQACDRALQHDEASTRKFRCGVKIDEPELLAERDMIERLERELRRSSPPSYLDVRASPRLPAPTRAAGSVARRENRRARLSARRVSLARAELFRKSADLALQRLDVAACSLRFADRLGTFVARLSQAFDAHLQCLCARLRARDSVRGRA